METKLTNLDYSVSCMNALTGADIRDRVVFNADTLKDLKSSTKDYVKESTVKAVRVQAVPLRSDLSPNPLAPIRTFTINSSAQIRFEFDGTKSTIKVPHLYEIKVTDNQGALGMKLKTTYGLSVIKNYETDFAEQRIMVGIIDLLRERTRISLNPKFIGGYKQCLFATPVLLFKDYRAGTWRVASLVSLLKHKEKGEEDGE